MPRRTLTSRKHKLLTIELPPEFIALCKRDNVPPEAVLRGLIADLCEITNSASNPRADGYQSNGSSECEHARAYYDRVGHPWLHRPQR